MTQSPQISSGSKSFETAEHRVSCDGGGGALGHPKVYMDMGQEDFVVCKYCGREFILKS